MSQASPSARTFWTQYWQGLYATPRAWAHKGENLVHAFEVVASASVEDSGHLNLKDQALMLAGMAIEVLLKAILVSVPEHRPIVTASKQPIDIPGKALWKTFRSHRLVDLARQATIALSADREGTAATLTQYIYWRGRYVLPTEHGINDLIPVEGDDGLVGPAHQITVDAARDLLHHVISEAKARLYDRV
jgi:hypothetical protein